MLWTRNFSSVVFVKDVPFYKEPQLHRKVNETFPTKCFLLQHSSYFNESFQKKISFLGTFTLGYKHRAHTGTFSHLGQECVSTTETGWGVWRGSPNRQVWLSKDHWLDKVGVLLTSLPAEFHSYCSASEKCSGNKRPYCCESSTMRQSSWQQLVVLETNNSPSINSPVEIVIQL